MIVTDKKQLRDSRLSSSNPLELQLAKRSGLKKEKKKNAPQNTYENGDML